MFCSLEPVLELRREREEGTGTPPLLELLSIPEAIVAEVGRMEASRGLTLEGAIPPTLEVVGDCRANA